MHTAELLDEALALATQLGYRIRQEWLDGAGGMCVVHGENWLFIDLAQPLAEQLESVATILRSDLKASVSAHSEGLQELLKRTKPHDAIA